MGFFYAVRKGKHIGIFSTWDECKQQVTGYSGAEYKKLKTEEEAKAYLYGNSTVITKNNSKFPTNFAYVDGSFNSQYNVYGYGIFLKSNKGSYIVGGANNDPRASQYWNIAGELEGVKAVLKFAWKNNIENLTIYYDYEGIEKWANDSWKAKNEYTQEYKDVVKKARERVDVTFVKVKAHSGVALNEYVDKIASESIKNFIENNTRKTVRALKKSKLNNILSKII